MAFNSLQQHADTKTHHHRRTTVAKECFDQCGEKVKRVGKASVKRILMDPVRVTSDSKEKDMAMVACPDAEVYISRDGAGQRSCTFYVLHWEDEEPISEEFEFSERDTAINKFLRLIK